MKPSLAEAASSVLPRGSVWAFYQRLSKRYRRPLVNLRTHPPDARLLEFSHIEHYIRAGFLPWRLVAGHLVLACSHPQRLEAHNPGRVMGRPVVLVYASPRDIRMSLERHFSDRLDKDTCQRLKAALPDYSASETLQFQQKRGGVLLLCLLTLSAMIAPQMTLLASLLFINAAYLLSIVFKMALILRPLPRCATAPPLSDEALPVYTVLVPMVQEAEAAPRLLHALRQLDYPRHKLDIKLVLEADDEATYQAIIALKPEACFDIIRVPPSQPRTKPKACSYALRYARGSLVVIYDSEDYPEPGQLRLAAAEFAAAPADVACFQARLNYYNWNESLLTRCFAIEYAALFDLLLPGLQHAGIPIPLGGTSNHLRLSCLREVYDWDPYNVTEDADLGLRLASRGYRTQMLDSVTLEEAPLQLGAWLKQRSRWIKGYMQTWLVFMRRPLTLYRQLGPVGFWGFHCMVGLPCLIFLCAPLLWALCVLCGFGIIALPAVTGLLTISVTIFALGIATQIYLAMRAGARWKWHNLRFTALIYPCYWLLHSVASLKSFWQLLWRPHYWEKTRHACTALSLRHIEAAVEASRKHTNAPISG